MPVTFNIRHLEQKNLQLQGTLTPQELGLESVDELIHPANSLEYDLEVEKQDDSYLVQGLLRLELECECARCLKKFMYPIEIPDWSVLLETEGPEPVPVHNDVVDLTPYLREDTLLSFPQHPLCEPECPGLLSASGAVEMAENDSGLSGTSAAAWAALDKLKL